MFSISGGYFISGVIYCSCCVLFGLSVTALHDSVTVVFFSVQVSINMWHFIPLIHCCSVCTRPLLLELDGFINITTFFIKERCVWSL